MKYRDITRCNGALIPSDNLSGALHKGFGVFETMRARKTGSQATILGFSLHLRRLISGARELGIESPYLSESDLLSEVSKAMATFDWSVCSDAVVRIIALKDSLIVRCNPWVRRLPESGAHLVSYIGERSMPHIKHCSTIISELSMQSALKQNGHEGLLVDTHHRVLECSWSNLFWFDSAGVLCTPPTNALPGITQSLIVNHLPQKVTCRQEHVTLQTLTQSSEVFITNSLHGVIPVVKINEHTLKIGSRTQEITSYYQSLNKQSDLISVFNI